jgi:hypothetical protein
VDQSCVGLDVTGKESQVDDLPGGLVDYVDDFRDGGGICISGQDESAGLDQVGCTRLLSDSLVGDSGGF